MKIIVVAGDKGGTGKTFVALLIADWLRVNAKEPECWDFDQSNSAGFGLYWEGAKKGNLDERGALFRPFAGQNVGDLGDRVLLLDLGARNEAKAGAWFDAAGSFLEQKEAAVKWTVVVPVTADEASWWSAHAWVKRASGRASVLLIKNQGEEAYRDFGRWDRHPETLALKKKGLAEELDLRSAAPELTEYARAHKLRIGQIAAGAAGSLAEQMMAAAVAAPFYAELDGRKELLL
ncbi:MAG: hypothetical protein PHO89_01140 [Methylacidiphilaceae bacterium]|nr:hypothetical protein [Candidatus Methylacidiphilaceae bacterium]